MLVPILLWPMLSKENRYFYTRHSNNNDRWFLLSINIDFIKLKYEMGIDILYFPPTILYAPQFLFVCPLWMMKTLKINFVFTRKL